MCSGLAFVSVLEKAGEGQVLAANTTCRIQPAKITQMPTRVPYGNLGDNPVTESGIIPLFQLLLHT